MASKYKMFSQSLTQTNNISKMSIEQIEKHNKNGKIWIGDELQHASNDLLDKMGKLWVIIVYDVYDAKEEILCHFTLNCGETNKTE